MDRELFEKMFGYAQKNRRFGFAIVSLTKASSKIFFVIYTLVLFFFRYKPDKLIPAIIIPFTALCASLALRSFFKRPRPCEAIGKKTYSLPSNHSTSAAVIACTCMYCHMGLGLAVLALAFLTGASRVFSGLHYPSDVAAGWFIGCLSSCMYLILI